MWCVVFGLDSPDPRRSSIDCIKDGQYSIVFRSFILWGTIVLASFIERCNRETEVEITIERIWTNWPRSHRRILACLTKVYVYGRYILTLLMLDAISVTLRHLVLYQNHKQMQSFTVRIPRPWGVNRYSPLTSYHHRTELFPLFESTDTYCNNLKFDPPPLSHDFSSREPPFFIRQLLFSLPLFIF